MDALALELAQQLRWRLVRVHRDTRRRLGSLV
jgi:hypothetical protein